MDYLPFERIVYRKPEITSIAEDVWIWFIYTTEPVSAGAHGENIIYTIPTGYKAVISDIGVGAEFRGEAKYYISGGDNIYWTYHEPYDTKNHSFVMPPVALAGESVIYEIWNRDIISGHWRSFMSMWLIPGSKPEKPKNDDPEERFRVGDFTVVNQLILPNGETLYLFHKRGEGKENYLKFKDYGLKSQKKLASFHLKNKEEREILSTIRDEPNKVRPILEKYERKYKLITSDFEE